MKRMLMTLVCAATLRLHASQLEEAQRIIREAVEERGHSRTPVRDLWLLELTALEKDVLMSECCEILSERFADLKPEQLYPIISSFYYLDGVDLASYGNQEALDWTRRITRKLKEEGREYMAWYLGVKGDARDLDIFENIFKDFLAMRVAGTNMFQPYTIRYEDSLFACAPSVTNTGPQALYVEAILKQAWNALEIEYRSWKEGLPPYHFRDISKIPDELLTMVVWFDENGNPVCNVDLAKYGLTMPEIDLSQKVRDEIRRRAKPNVAADSPSRAGQTPDNESDNPADPKTTPWKLPLLIGIAAIIGTMAAWRCFRRK